MYNEKQKNQITIDEYIAKFTKNSELYTEYKKDNAATSEDIYEKFASKYVDPYDKYESDLHRFTYHWDNDTIVYDDEYKELYNVLYSYDQFIKKNILPDNKGSIAIFTNNYDYDKYIKFHHLDKINPNIKNDNKMHEKYLNIILKHYNSLKNQNSDTKDAINKSNIRFVDYDIDLNDLYNKIKDELKNDKLQNGVLSIKLTNFPSDDGLSELDKLDLKSIKEHNSNFQKPLPYIKEKYQEKRLDKIKPRIPEPKFTELYTLLIIASLFGMIVYNSSFNFTESKKIIIDEFNDFAQTKKIIKIIIDELQKLGIIDDVEPEKIIKLLGL